MASGQSDDEAADGLKLTSHLGLVVSGVLAFIVALRLLAISNFSATTAGMVLTERGTTDVLVGTLLPSISLVILLVGLAITAWAMLGDQSDRKRRLRPAQLVIVGLALLLAPWPVAAVTIVATLLMFLISFLASLLFLSKQSSNIPALAGSLDDQSAETRRQRLARARRDRSRTLAYRFSLGLLGIGVLIFLTTGIPWMPAEQVSLRSGDTHVGYVLRDAQERLILMTEKDRRILILPAKGVERREVCIPEDAYGALDGRPVVALVLSPSDSVGYPRCPK